MARAAGPGRCVHCLKDVQHRNWDHILPVSWYPDSTPSNLEKWKVPSCVPCNHEHGKNEEWLLLSFGFCLDPADPASAGIVERAQRAINPQAGRDPKDAYRRARLRERFARQIRHFKTPPTTGVFPNFGALVPDRNGYTGIPIDGKRVKRLAAKIVRGVVFMEKGLHIDDSYEFTLSIMEKDAAASIVQTAQAAGGIIDREPGISITRAYLPSDPRAGIFAIEIWKRCWMYAVVSPKDIAEAVKAEFLTKHGPDAIEAIEQAQLK